MTDLKFFSEVPYNIENYLDSLKTNVQFEYKPVTKGLTKSGNRLKLGFSNYGLKLNYMLGNTINNPQIKDWANYINSYQKKTDRFTNFSYVDDGMIKGYKYLGLNNEVKYVVKSISNNLLNKSFNSKEVALNNAINAETKQSISTLYQVGQKNKYKLENRFNEFNDVETYLDSLDWSKPWSAGAQYSSICVYSVTQQFEFEDMLYKYLSKIIDSDTGSYFNYKPTSSREIINGAMKVITGLDWLNFPIHKPEKLIDFCLRNIPIDEGCDIVDFVYVLFKCSKETSYRKKEINEIFSLILSQLTRLYVSHEGAFSYFINKSQSYYYGVKISDGRNVADLHGTLLSLWAIFMIMDNMEMLESNFRIIKP